MAKRKSDARAHRTSKALHAKFIEVLIRLLPGLNALAPAHLFGQGNEIACRPPARWLRLYQLRSFACRPNLCFRARLMSAQIRRRLFHNCQDPSLLLRARRAALAG